MFGEYGIERKIAAIVSDNASGAVCASDMVAASLARDFQTPVAGLRCLPHILNLVVKEAFDGTNVKGPLAKLRAAVIFLRAGSHQGKISHSSARRCHPLELDMGHDTLHAAYEKALNCVTAKTKITLDHLDWQTIEEVAKILIPFNDATVMLSSSSFSTLTEGEFVLSELVNFLSLSESLDVNKEDMLAKLQGLPEGDPASFSAPAILQPEVFPPPVQLREESGRQLAQAHPPRSKNIFHLAYHGEELFAEPPWPQVGLRA